MSGSQRPGTAPHLPSEAWDIYHGLEGLRELGTHKVAKSLCFSLRLSPRACEFAHGTRWDIVPYFGSVEACLVFALCGLRTPSSTRGVGLCPAMVKKLRKRENRKLAIVQQEKIKKRLRDKREEHGLSAPSAGQSFAHIKNKQKRSQMVSLMRQDCRGVTRLLPQDKKKQKAKVRRARKEAEARGEEVQRQEPRSIDKMREADETIVPAEDSEVEEDEAMDETRFFFSCMDIRHDVHELVNVIPNAFYYPRRDFPFKKICEYASNKDFTDVMLFHEKAKVLQGVYISHLPKGLAAVCEALGLWGRDRLSAVEDMKGGATCNASHNPELILNGFVTRLGRRLARQFAALFPQRPDFEGRRTGSDVAEFSILEVETVTFHNQRDFIFFRHYRYVFKEDGTKCKLQEIGPRFTLKCRYLQHGTFDAKEGEYEFIWRPDSQVSRKKFFV
eukprot:s177_g20.t1